MLYQFDMKICWLFYRKSLVRLHHWYSVFRPNIRPNLWKKLPNIRFRPNLILAGSAKVRFRPNLNLNGSVKVRFGRTSFWPVRCITTVLLYWYRTCQNEIRPKPNIWQFFSKVRPNIRPKHRKIVWPFEGCCRRVYTA